MGPTIEGALSDPGERPSLDRKKPSLTRRKTAFGSGEALLWTGRRSNRFSRGGGLARTRREALLWSENGRPGSGGGAGVAGRPHLARKTSDPVQRGGDQDCGKPLFWSGKRLIRFRRGGDQDLREAPPLVRKTIDSVHEGGAGPGGSLPMVLKTVEPVQEGGLVQWETLARKTADLVQERGGRTRGKPSIWSGKPQSRFRRGAGLGGSLPYDPENRRAGKERGGLGSGKPSFGPENDLPGSGGGLGPWETLLWPRKPPSRFRGARPVGSPPLARKMTETVQEGDLDP
jgi:hypothetical protein